MEIRKETTSPSPTTQETWDTALQWVTANQQLVRKIASPYFRHIAGDRDDLYQEATIAAFKAVITAGKKGKPKQFIPFFRVIFKTSCIKLASGIETTHSLESDFLICPEKKKIAEKPKVRKINQALQVVSKRQREVCRWLLRQPTPVSTPDIAREFQVSRRHACRLVSNSVQKIAEAGQ
jgi:RNA polymerase sigma factor (sigma-70 family)